MSISVQCDCGRKLKAPEKFAGSRAVCPSCGNAVLIPQEGSSQEGLSQGASNSEPHEELISEFLDPPTAESVAPQPATSKPEHGLMRVMFEALLDPRSIQWMLTLGGGLLVLGVIIWLVSLGIFEDPTVLAVTMGIGTAAILGSGWWLTLKTRFHMAGQALTFLGCVVAPLNLWFYDAQSLITLDDHLWVGGVVCCLIYVATVYVLRDPLFMYAVEAGVTLTALLLMADLQWISDISFLSTFLTALGLFSIHAERGFAPGDDEHFNRRRFGMPLFWSGHAQLAVGLLILLATQTCDWLLGAEQAVLEAVIGLNWINNLRWHSPLLAGALWVAGTYAYLYSDIVVRRVGIYTYLAAFCLLFVEVTVLGDVLRNTEAVIAAFAVTAMTANLLRNVLRQSSDRLERAATILAQVMSALPVFMGIVLHLRATSPLAGQMIGTYESTWTFVFVMLLVAGCNRASAFLFRNENPRISAEYFLMSAGALVVAAAGLLRLFGLLAWTQQAPLLMMIPIGYLVASRLWMGRSPERPLVWIAHAATAIILVPGLVATVDTLDTVLKPIQGHLDNLLLGIVFGEAAVFYLLAGLFRKRNVSVYFASAAACISLWQLIGYWGQIDPAYYTMLYAVVGVMALGIGRAIGLETIDVYSVRGEKSLRLSGRGLALLQSGNAILIVALLAALMQGLAQLATHRQSVLTLTALLLTTSVSFVAIAVVPAGSGRRLYWSSSIVLSALCFLTFNVMLDLSLWQKLEIFCVVLGIFMITTSYAGRFLEIQQISNDTVTLGLWFGSLLVTVPLMFGLGYYRLSVGMPHWPEELTLVVLTILMLITGYSWKVKSTTLTGGAALCLYLFIILGQLAYQPQIATGVYLAIGGGLVFLVGVGLSVYRETLLLLPDRIAKREGVFQVIGWR